MADHISSIVTEVWQEQNRNSPNSSTVSVKYFVFMENGVTSGSIGFNYYSLTICSQFYFYGNKKTTIIFEWLGDVLQSSPSSKHASRALAIKYNPAAR